MTMKFDDDKIKLYASADDDHTFNDEDDDLHNRFEDEEEEVTMTSDDDEDELDWTTTERSAKRMQKKQPSSRCLPHRQQATHPQPNHPLFQ